MNKTPRAPIDALLDSLTWEALPPPEDASVLHATHAGVLEIGDAALRVHVLSDGRRVIVAEDLEKFFGLGLLPEVTS